MNISDLHRYWSVAAAAGITLAAAVSSDLTGNTNIIIDKNESCRVSGDRDSNPVNILDTSFNAATGKLNVIVHYKGMRENYPELYNQFMRHIPIANGTIIRYLIGKDDTFINSVGMVETQEHLDGHVTGRGYDLSAPNVEGRPVEPQRTGPHWDTELNVNFYIVSTSSFKDYENKKGYIGHFSLAVENNKRFGHPLVAGTPSSVRVRSWQEIETDNGGLFQFICESNVYPIGGTTAIESIQIQYNYAPN